MVLGVPTNPEINPLLLRRRPQIPVCRELWQILTDCAEEALITAAAEYVG